MYKSFFQLRVDPFNNSPDPRFLLMTPHAKEALAALRYGISARKGFMVITGEPGTGKTTLLRYALSSLDQSRILTSFVFNPRLEMLDFLEFILSDFGIVPMHRTKSSMLLQFNRWLIDRYREGKICVVVVDEAQHLEWELLEEVRLLTNLETSNEKLLQIVLSGQPEFEEKLRKIDARQLRQRITLSCRTLPLTAEQIGPYVDQRIKTSLAREPASPESSPPVFSPEVLRLIHQASRGIPRVVNLICEHSLIYSYVEHQHEISTETVRGVLGDLEIDGAPLFPSDSELRGESEENRSGHKVSFLSADETNAGSSSFDKPSSPEAAPTSRIGEMSDKEAETHETSEAKPPESSLSTDENATDENVTDFELSSVPELKVEPEPDHKGGENQ